MKSETKQKTARGMSVEILDRIVATQAFAEPLLDAYLSCSDLPNIHDRRLLTELVYGVLRMQGHLDWIILKLYQGNFSSLDLTIKNILRTGLYQLLCTNRIPHSAAVNEAVTLVKAYQPAAAGLVNAILRNYLRRRNKLSYPLLEEDPLGYISVVHSHPRWLVKRWLALYGQEKTQALCAANNEIPPTTLRVNRLKVTREDVASELREEGRQVEETTCSPDGLIIAKQGPPLRETAHFRKGDVLVQDEASQLIAQLLAPFPGANVLDLCAGNGIKTTHIAELMNNKGVILSLDINGGKLTSLRQLADRLGIGIIATRVVDATLDLGSPFHNHFDRILVDAPCSGLGTLRRNPEIKWRLRPEDIGGSSAVQKKLLHNAAVCLKPGGILVYSVCTVTPEENEQVIEDFLRRHEDFSLSPSRESAVINLYDEHGFVHTGPENKGMDGFFAAVLIRGQGEKDYKQE